MERDRVPPSHAHRTFSPNERPRQDRYGGLEGVSGPYRLSPSGNLYCNSRLMPVRGKRNESFAGTSRRVWGSRPPPPVGVVGVREGPPWVSWVPYVLLVVCLEWRWITPLSPGVAANHPIRHAPAGTRTQSVPYIVYIA